MRHFYHYNRNADLTDAVGDYIGRQKQKKFFIKKAKVVTWLIVVLAIIALVLITSINIAS